MASGSDLKRAFYAQQLGISNTQLATLTEADLENLFYQNPARSSAMGALLAAASKPDPASPYSTTSATPVPIDINLLKVTFTVPASGRVRVGVGANVGTTNSATSISLSVYAGPLVTDPFIAYWTLANGTQRQYKTATAYISGLTPGSQQTWYLYFASENNVNSVNIGDRNTFIEVFGA